MEKVVAYRFLRRPKKMTRVVEIASRYFQCGQCKNNKKPGSEKIYYVDDETGKIVACVCSETCDAARQRDLGRLK